MVRYRNVILSFLASALLLSASAAWGACVIEPMDFGESRSGVIATDDCKNNTNNTTYYYDSYVFSGVAGQKIAVTMNTTSGIDPFLFLVNPDKTFVSDNNSGGGVNARVPATGFMTLAQTGTYEIQAVTAVPLTTGSYTVSLASSTPAACHVAADPQSSATLPIARGTPVTISAVCASGTTPITYSWDNGAFTGASRTVTPTQTTTYSIVGTNANGSSPPFTITVHVAAPPPGVPTIEFYNINLAHYFVTATQAEATAIDNGSAGPGWVRTGFSYDVYTGPVNQGGIVTVPVCRFYGTPGKGPNSHFYTADATECEQVKRDPGWTYEGIAYHIQPWVGTCPAGTLPIYRTYNNRAAQNDSNHRFITNSTTFDLMGGKGWSKEGIVMCTPAVRAPTPVTGGTFNDPAGSGAGMSIPAGQLPGYVNATQPQTGPRAGPGQLPPGVVNPSEGETNVTMGSPNGYDFNLTGDDGFTTVTPNAITINVPFNASAVPAVDRSNPAKVFVRAYHPGDGSTIDLLGDITVNGASGLVSVKTQGLGDSFTALVIYNPDADTDVGDQATFEQPALDKSTRSTNSTAATRWPGQGWCVHYNSRNAALVAATRVVLGLARAPTVAEIKAVIRSRATAYALLAQTIYQNDNMGAPNMGTGTACGPTPRYYLHVGTFLNGSFFQPDDPGAATNANGKKYGRLYINAARLDDTVGMPLGTSLASVAHEMLHAIHNGYRIVGTSTFGFQEGSAALYGTSIDHGGAVTVRFEPTHLDEQLLDPVYEANNQYGSEDFFAYVANAYNGGKLSYLSGVFAALRAALGPDAVNPAITAQYAALDSYLNTTFKKSLATAYLEFVRDRALIHSPASVLRASENFVGYERSVFYGKTGTIPIDLAACSRDTLHVPVANNPSFSSFALELVPTGNLPPNSNGLTLRVTLSATSGTVGTTWKGWSYRNNVATLVETATVKFPLWGKPGDPVVVVLSNLDPARRDDMKVSIDCKGPIIDSLTPARGKAGDVITLNGSNFGVAADVRSVTINGVAATGVTWISDAQVRVTVPPNASSGDVVITVNGEKSNGVNFEMFAACSAQQNAGGDTPDTRTIELGKTSGTFNFTYETFAQEDRIIVRYQNNVLFDTGCVGANGTRPITYGGTQTFITVQVIPNCRTGTGTAWNYSVSCP